jgi:hypothetical protein
MLILRSAGGTKHTSQYGNYGITTSQLRMLRCQATSTITMMSLLQCCPLAPWQPQAVILAEELLLKQVPPFHAAKSRLQEKVLLMRTVLGPRT